MIEIRCKVCDAGTLLQRKKYRMSGPVVAIGYILLVPSILGILISVMSFARPSSVPHGAGSDAAIGMVGGFTIIFGIAAFVMRCFCLGAEAGREDHRPSGQGRQLRLRGDLQQHRCRQVLQGTHGATFTLELPDGRLAIVRCEYKFSERKAGPVGTSAAAGRPWSRTSSRTSVATMRS